MSFFSTRSGVEQQCSHQAQVFCLIPEADISAFVATRPRRVGLARAETLVAPPSKAVSRARKRLERSTTVEPIHDHREGVEGKIQHQVSLSDVAPRQRQTSGVRRTCIGSQRRSGSSTCPGRDITSDRRVRKASVGDMTGFLPMFSDVSSSISKRSCCRFGKRMDRNSLENSGAKTSIWPAGPRYCPRSRQVGTIPNDLATSEIDTRRLRQAAPV
jgi:hypothetical protein